MTLTDQINQTIDRVQDVLVDFPDQVKQRIEIRLVLLDLLHATSKVMAAPPFPNGEVLSDETRRLLAEKGIRFLLLPDDFTVSP